jgi:hypothetical protein
MEVTAAKRIRDRNIEWKEIYKKRSLFVKEKFDQAIGPQSYFRWEGDDKEEGNEYYIIVSPSLSDEYGKAFFSGIRKMPADYPPSGKYFKSIREALRYARKVWGVPIPMPLPRWTTAHLEGVDITKVVT